MENPNWPHPPEENPVDARQKREDEHQRIEEELAQPASTPLRAGQQPQNVMDQPLPLVFSRQHLGLFYFVSHLLSCNALVFLRRRVGERNLHMWVILLNVTFLLLLSWLGNAPFPNPASWLHGQTASPETAQPYSASPYRGSPYGGSPYGVSPYGDSPGFQAAPNVPASRGPFYGAPVQTPPPKSDGGAWLVKLYALALLLIGWYQNGMSKEWGEILPDLTTFARGQSRLGRFLNRRVIPKAWHGFGFAWSFTQWKCYDCPWFPLEERLIHSYLEPILLILLGLFCWKSDISWMMSAWLFLSSLALKITEYQYYDIGQSLYLDRRDAKREAKAVRKAEEEETANGKTPSGEPKIDASLPVQVSEELLQRRKRRRLIALMNGSQDESAPTHAEDRLKREALERMQQRRNGKGGRHP